MHLTGLFCFLSYIDFKTAIYYGAFKMCVSIKK